MTRLLITGASGLLGLNLAIAAYSHIGRPNAGYQVTGLVHSYGLAF